MKFAHEFRAALAGDQYPSHWVERAIPYSQLKKCLKKVTAELHGFGLDPIVLRELMSREEATYKLDNDGSNHLKPRLTILVRVKDGVPFDAALSPDTRATLRKLASRSTDECLERRSSGGTDTSCVIGDNGIVSDGGTGGQIERVNSGSGDDNGIGGDGGTGSQIERLNNSSGDDNGIVGNGGTGGQIERVNNGSGVDNGIVCDRGSGSQIERASNDNGDDNVSGDNGSEEGMSLVELPLVFDEQFFEQLTEDVLRLGQLQRQEEETIRGEIVELGSDVGNLAAPPGRSLVHRRSDMNRWRAIFDVYVGAEVFFSTHELDHGARTAEGALEKLRWFEAEVARQGLIGQFKLRESAQAYARFVRVNVTLLKCMRFQEINRLAVAKILKKFDKCTALGVSGRFPEAVGPVDFFSRSVAKDLCAALSTELLSLVPRLDDYLCPVCMSIAYMPVRLACGHLFCVRCVVKLQRTRVRCPLCRSTTLGEANGANLDVKMEKFMRKHFPKEVGEKHLSNERERGKETYGEDYEPEKCTVM